MIPIGSTIRRLFPPVATLALIAANVVVFLMELSVTPAQLDLWVTELGVVPLRQTWALSEQPLALDAWLTPMFTGMFLHGGWAHLIGNMLFLWVFGSGLEGRLGTRPFLLLYAAAGVAAAQAQVLAEPMSPVPMVGASGAIAGIMGAYLLMFPLARIVVAVPILFIPLLFELPAVVFLGVWFAEQLVLGGLSALTPTAGAAAGVAWWAHIGGFAAGAAAIAWMGKRSIASWKGLSS